MAPLNLGEALDRPPSESFFLNHLTDIFYGIMDKSDYSMERKRLDSIDHFTKHHLIFNIASRFSHKCCYH